MPNTSWDRMPQLVAHRVGPETCLATPLSATRSGRAVMDRLLSCFHQARPFPGRLLDKHPEHAEPYQPAAPGKEEQGVCLRVPFPA